MQVAEPNQRQALLIEYEILDSFWTHQHQWIWLSGLILIALSMLGMTFLPVGLESSPIQIPLITFVALLSGALIVIWWGILRQMLNSLQVVQHRKREIEKGLGMRMELYMNMSRQGGGKRGKARRLANEESEDDPDMPYLAGSESEEGPSGKGGEGTGPGGGAPPGPAEVESGEAVRGRSPSRPLCQLAMRSSTASSASLSWASKGMSWSL